MVFFTTETDEADDRIRCLIAATPGAPSGVDDTLTLCSRRSTLSADFPRRKEMAPTVSVHVSALSRAAELLGHDALAGYLGVRSTHITAWMSGQIEVPSDVFLKVVDFLMEYDLAIADKQQRRFARGYDGERR